MPQRGAYQRYSLYVKELITNWNSSATFWRWDNTGKNSTSFAMMHSGISCPCHAVNYDFLMPQSVKLTLTFQRHLCRKVYLQFHRSVAATGELGKSKRDFQ